MNPTHDLFKAVCDEDVIATQLLLKQGVLPSVKDQYGRTPLHNTLSVEVAKVLLAHGALPNALNESGSTPLHCYFQPSVELVRLLLNHGALPNARNMNGQTPLHCLAECSDQSVIEVLVNSGADIEAQDEHSNTPLHHAVAYNNLDIMNMLLSRGASPNVQNDKGETPLYRASTIDQIEILVSNGADVDAKDKQSRTLLHKLVTIGHPFVIKHLLAQKASPYVEDISGEIPIHKASQMNVLDGLTRRQSPHAQDSNQKILNKKSHAELVALRQTFNAKVLELLLEAGSPIHARDKLDNTPLHMAAKFSDDLSIVAMLVKHGASVHAKNQQGMTPLHVAVKFSTSSSIVETLCNRGAAVNIRDKNGHTPLFLAVQRERYGDSWYNKHLNKNIVRLLLAYGAYVHEPSGQHYLSQYWEIPFLLVEEDEPFYTTLLLTGTSRNRYNGRLPGNLGLIQDNIESTVRSWLTPCITEGRAAVNWPAMTPNVLRALPRLIHFIKRLESQLVPSIKPGYTVDTLKSLFFIPKDKLSRSSMYFLSEECVDDIKVYKPATEEDYLMKFQRSGTLRALEREQLPVELILAIRERLADWAMVDTLIADYQLDASVANYLVFDVKAHLNDYITFLKRLFEHDWRKPCSPPVTTTENLASLQSSL